MSISVPSTAVVGYQPALSEAEQLTLAGSWPGYRGYTRDAYALDLRQFTGWCLQRGRHLFDVRRVDIECFTRDLEDTGKARATIARRSCTIGGFYRHAEEDGGSNDPQGSTSAARRSTTSPTSSVPIPTRTGPSWSPPVSRRHATTPSSR